MKRLGKWRVPAGLYVAFLVLGISVMHLRHVPGGGSLIAALALSVSAPEQLQYVAASDLESNHRIEPGDLVVDPRLGYDLYRYLPDPAGLTGKYVLSPIRHGQPIAPDSLGEHALGGAADDLVLRLQITGLPASTNPWPPGSKVTITSLHATSSVEALVLSSTAPAATNQSALSHRPPAH